MHTSHSLNQENIFIRQWDKPLIIPDRIIILHTPLIFQNTFTDSSRMNFCFFREKPIYVTEETEASSVEICKKD